MQILLSNQRNYRQAEFKNNCLRWNHQSQWRTHHDNIWHPSSPQNWPIFRPGTFVSPSCSHFHDLLGEKVCYYELLWDATVISEPVRKMWLSRVTATGFWRECWRGATCLQLDSPTLRISVDVSQPFSLQNSVSRHRSLCPPVTSRTCQVWSSQWYFTSLSSLPSPAECSSQHRRALTSRYWGWRCPSPNQRSRTDWQSPGRHLLWWTPGCSCRQG